ncbi:hypothetical protein Tco_0365350 [Tanacetum coccineum]
MERITIKEFKVESKVFNLLEIDVDLFTYDTPLGTIFDEFRRLSGMKNDLFTYEVECYDEYERIFAEAVILIEDRLVKLIAITLEQWLDLKFGDHKKVYKEIMEGVVGTRIKTDVECDPANAEFAKWLASKFNNYITMDWYTKNALWLYWKRGDDEDVLTYDELSDLEEENLKFKEFNHLLQIDVDVLTRDLPGFKTYEDYKNTWIYECNNEVPWVEEKPWLDNDTWKEPNDDICHECKPFKEEESSEDAWINYLPNDDSDVIQANQEWLDNHEPMEEEERFKEKKSKLLGIPYKKPPTFKFGRFEDLIWRIQYHGYDVSTLLEVLNVNEESGVIIEHLAKDGKTNMFWSINEEVRESLLNLKNTMYHSIQILRILILRRIQDHCMALKNTLYPHHQIRRIRNFGQLSEEARLIDNTPYPKTLIRCIEWGFMNIPEYNNRGAYAK